MSQQLIRMGVAAIVALLVAVNADALTVRVDVPPHEIPATINYMAVDASPLEITLQLLNEASVDTEPVATWQLALKIVPELDAQGELQFESFTTPEASLFGEWSSPTALSDLPANELVIADFDSSDEFGVIIGATEAPPVISLQISASEASGAFGLFIEVDEENVDRSSFWTGQDAIPIAFANQTAVPSLLKLATIQVSEDMALPGDFNDDLVVDAADYTVWRDGLNTLFGPEHYGIWKEHFGETHLGPSLSAEVPEPARLLPFVAAICMVSRLRSRQRLRLSIIQRNH